MKKVSVIVPVYKVESYIERCINSIINQDYENIEIICVDDGSPDRSPVLLDQIQKQDPRVLVIHKTNGGVSSARNAGIEAATGDYITFVDSDDYVEKNYISYLVSMIGDKYPIGMNENVFGDKKGDDVIKNSISNEEAIEKIFLGEIFVAVWNKIYDLNYINKHNIRFHEDIWFGEGMLFNIEALQFTDKVAVGSLGVYHQTPNPNSAMRSFDLNSRYNGIKSLRIQRTLIPEKKNIIQAFEYHLWVYNWYIVGGLVSTSQKKEHIKEYISCTRELRKGILIPWKVHIPIYKKLMYTSISFFPTGMAYINKYRSNGKAFR